MQTANRICRTCGQYVEITSVVSHDGPRLVRAYCRICDTSEVFSEPPQLVEPAANKNRFAGFVPSAATMASVFAAGAVFSWFMG